MMKRRLPILLGAVLCAGAVAHAQSDQASARPSAVAPALPPTRNLPRAMGPQFGNPNNLPGAGAPGITAVPPEVAPGMPSLNQVPKPQPTQHFPPPAEASTSSALISFLDSTAPFVQAFDFLLMIAAGIFCLRASRAPGLTILAVSCFVSAIILLGFFLFGIFHGRGLLPQVGYIAARLLAPFELLLFAIGLIVVARANVSRG